MIALPFTLETPLERKLAADPLWQRGMQWGTPRPGHLEGQVMYHVADVLANIDRQRAPDDVRRQLRLIALIHDTFKFQVDTSRPRVGPNHHAARARAWAARYIQDASVLRVLALHDEAYHAWRFGTRTQRWDEAEQQALQLAETLGPDLALFIRFYRADNQTPSKNPEPVAWFERALRLHGFPVPDAAPIAGSIALP